MDIIYENVREAVLLVHDHPRPNPNQVAWNSQLDNRFMVEVQSVSPYTGMLKIFDHQDGDKELFSEQVGIAYEARFSPDVADVAEWSDKAANWIDANIYGVIDAIKAEQA